MLNLDKRIPRTESEIRQQQKLERIRQCEEMRKERFFNAKKRLLGKDIEALDKQVEENKLRKNLENEVEEAFYNQQMADVESGNSIQRKTDDERKQLAKEIDAYRLNEQQMHMRREFDLNDPNRISNQMPMILPDITDPRELTKTSLLSWNSEDYDGLRAKAMKKHLWQCLAKQMSENFVIKNNYKLSHIQSGKDTMKQDEMVNKAVENEEKNRIQLAKNILEYNKRKAEFDSRKRQLEKDREDADEMVHINTSINSVFLTENREGTKSSLGLGGILRYNHKGMTDEEIKELRKIQLNQIEELKERKKVEKASEKYWMEVEDLQSRVKFVKVELEEEKRKEMNKQVLEENKKLATMQAIQRDIMDKMAKDNFPTEAFFNVFNTTSR